MTRKAKKIVPLVAMVAIVSSLCIGGTLAWSTDETDEVRNAFTVGKVDIGLAETTGETYQMVPGTALAKDPTVTVKAGSEDCWLFVKVEEGGGNVIVDGVAKEFDDFIAYSVIPDDLATTDVVEGWTPLGEAEHPGVYYRKAGAVAKGTADEDLPKFSVIRDAGGVADRVSVKDTVTKQMMAALEATGPDAYPKLTLTAYAVQLASFEPASASEADMRAAAEKAWAEVDK